MEMCLLEVENLKKHFAVDKGLFSSSQQKVKAIDGISFTLRQGETLGLVGESGCGKSTTALTVLRLLEATTGEVKFKGQDIYKLTKKELKALRKEMQIIFQDPDASLNPRQTVGDIIGEGLKIHNLASKETREAKVKELLNRVGLKSEQFLNYPHEFSGGQRQRIGIARALALEPELIVCDEPVSSLDVSIQAQIINLMLDLQKEFGLTYLFIAHNLNLVRYVSHRVAVMYLGKLVELAAKEEIYNNPQHPYTRALLSAIPIADPTVDREKIILEGELPSPINPPLGCNFHTRCPETREICRQEEPNFINRGAEHWVACHF
ncbi:ABC transporter ATP-binding protein [Fuchsiella alkaliacetigena]|uniref:ABC transporter ATP-binding protein n=1 Tax=Fuchsiella alkaliacetigena TaxID=957042 RepID=UPI00200B6556|nr:dipeptide ABC transporter ATP-binding protein [Fuchsiella alkaliacetigena]MCK8825588.1 dipeptide ABC transporter ATP-binding protein [Fuchsiella alkaliacetigena]